MKVAKAEAEESVGKSDRRVNVEKVQDGIESPPVWAYR